ncbi:MAG: M43 family zinc metalloprotease [Chitinophagales bacterium]
MKKLFSVLISFLLLTNNLLLHAQIQKCYSTEYLNNLQFTNPESYKNIINTQKAISLVNAKITDEVYMIPVVVHIVYASEAENLDDVRVFTQMNVLNDDFRRLNADTVNTPDAFVPVAADCEINFCLASFDPDGNPTTGIIRTHSDVEEWLLGFSDNIKSTELGGDDAWPASSYLNIWVCDLQGGVLGYSVSPGADPEVDGIVVDYKNFGLADVSSKPYDLGRTLTHEVGHWLGLNHIWGDDGGSCDGSDGCDDTPNQAGPSYGCLDFPALDTCSPEYPGIMFMNYMDYSDDNCMNIFTNCQKNKMRTVVETYRASILTSAAGCNDIPPLPGNVAEVLIYPVPSNGQFTVSIKNFAGTQNTMEIRIYDVLGQLIVEAAPEPANNVAQFFDLEGLAPGCYFVNVFNGTYFLNQEFMVY